MQAGKHLQNERARISLRSSIVKNVEAGMSQILKIILKTIFQSEKVDVLNIGLLLSGPTGCAACYERKHMKMTFEFMVEDGAAHKACWSLKGDAGTRFCGLCKNVFSHSEDDDGVSEVTRWTSFGQLQLTESEEVFASWDRMAGKWSTCSAGEFKRWQQAAGITFSPEAVLADRTLRDVLDPCRQYKHDWMHCLCSNGILSIGIYCLMEEWTAGRTLATMLVCGPSQASGNSVASMCKSCLQMRECKNTEKAPSSAALPVN